MGERLLPGCVDQKRIDVSSSALLADGARPAHLIGIALLVLLILLPAWEERYLDSKRGSP